MLATVLMNWKRSVMSGIKVEHIVCSDGACGTSRKLCEGYGARYYELPKRGIQGTHCKDKGMREAKGKYLIFWDDDNCYEPCAVSSLVSTAWGHDLGICQVRVISDAGVPSIPVRQDGDFNFADIDTACFCVKREVALLTTWQEQKFPGRDFHFLKALKALKPDLDISYSPMLIATHVAARLG
jgi:hypothetical protein